MNTRLKVLVVLTPPLDPTTGGVQMSSVKMLRMFAGLGYEAGAYSFEKEGHNPPEGARMFAAPEAGNVGNAANYQGLAAALAEFRPDVVINQMPYEHMIGETVRAKSDAVLLGCLRNTLYSVRNNLPAFAKQILPAPLRPFGATRPGRAALLALHRFRHARDLRKILEINDRFVMFAEPNLDELAWFVPDFDKGSVALAPNSIPEADEDLPGKEKRILWLARVSPHQKRADLILPLWRKLAGRLPDWRFDIVGDGDYSEVMNRRIEAEGLERITLHGRQPSMPWFSRSAVFVMTSAFEGFPNTLIEAQSKGAAPVVFDSYPMVRWLIRDGENGMLTPNGDIDAMADAIAGLCDDEEKRRAIATASLRSAAQFTEANVALRWRALLEEVTSERGAR